MGISPKINKRGGSNNRVGGTIPQKLINVEVLITHVVGKIFSKRIRKTSCLLQTLEYLDSKLFFFCRSAGNPVRDAKQFGGQSFGTVEKVQNCVETGSCQGDNNQGRPAVTGTSNFNKQHFEKVDQVHNCAATGSCQQQGKKKRSIIPQALVESIRYKDRVS